MKKITIIILVLIVSLCFGGCIKEDNPDDENDNKQNDDGINIINRSHALNYKEGVPMVDNGHVVYINWDGFARYYYDDFIKNEVDNSMPTLKMLLSEGVFFDDLHTVLPSITNPCQNMILSGSTSEITKNVYRYYNQKTNTVIQQVRENANPTIADVAVEAGLSVASVAHYLLEPVLSKGAANTYYISADSSLPTVAARGAGFENDHFARFEQLIRLVKGQEVNAKGGKTVAQELPQLIVFYADDLDALGHNEKGYYEYKRALTEEGRMSNVLGKLKEMDQKLGEFIQACKDANVYDQITFFLTTDHGMTPFGLSSLDDASDYGTSKLGELQSFLKKYNSKYLMEMVAAGFSPKSSTEVVAVGANLNLQLTWKSGISDDELAALKEELVKLKYVGNVLTRKELAAMGYMSGAADMIVTPAERYVFSSQPLAQYAIRGQHDSMLPSANHIYGIIWGNGIKKNHIYQDVAYNIDFGVTMAACLGLVIPNANGVVLDVFTKES